MIPQIEGLNLDPSSYLPLPKFDTWPARRGDKKCNIAAVLISLIYFLFWAFKASEEK